MPLQSALLVGLEGVFLQMIKNPSPNSSLIKKGLKFQDAAITMTYAAIILNIGAMVGFMQLIDELGRLPLLNARRELKSGHLEFKLTRKLTVNRVMGEFGFKGGLRSADWHCT